MSAHRELGALLVERPDLQRRGCRGEWHSVPSAPTGSWSPARLAGTRRCRSPGCRRYSAPPPEPTRRRLTRELETDMVVTISEPGLYVVRWLSPLRESAAGSTSTGTESSDWPSSGGIRIEDNVRITRDGADDNLTPVPGAAITP
ncbi:M24 family metallopeptidase [Billgrantia gudaonensis]|uniref:M24 family metallopeptidase n=1 Tax=Billgrantia gudaonensis TaxID=376427 RepID=A0A432JMB0_9GAMM|nr:M24 family metallopeptidase [Halomonas gudaonensis]